LVSKIFAASESSASTTSSSVNSTISEINFDRIVNLGFSVSQWSSVGMGMSPCRRSNS
jgi:hypothetical protein